jgi:hypothetical protein
LRGESLSEEEDPEFSGELRWSAMVAAGRRGERSRVLSLSFGWERFRPSDLGSTVEIRTYPFVG